MGVAPPSARAQDASQGVPSAALSTTLPAFTPSQELRLAVVMYGGVSLAIYINGVVQELLRLVRATAPASPPSDEEYPTEALLSEANLNGTEVVYRQLGQMIEWRRGEPAAPRTLHPHPEDPILTRFVVDILSGSSAGGINGIFLAKALANDEPIDQLKQLWLDEGDMELLVNDGRSYAGLTDLARQDPPLSVLNSRRLYWKLLGALHAMDETREVPGGPETPLVDELDLWITATDIRGLLRAIDLYDRVVWEKRYRNVFHFRYVSRWASGGDPTRNNLRREDNPFLAFVGRATSAFPFAFEPMVLEDIDEIVRNGTFGADYGGRDSTQPDWETFFHDYLRSGDTDRWYRHQAFGDGGYLDNKPFTWSTGTLQRRHADRPIDRKLIYIEPDPGTVHALRRLPGGVEPEPLPPGEQEGLARPDAIANVEAAVLTLPRAETIREDLDRLRERNREVARLARITETLESAVADTWTPLDKEAWLPLSPDELASSRGVQYLAYYRLKLASLLDDLAELVTLLAGFGADSDERSAIRCFIDAWFARHHEPGRDQNQFLLDLDLGYRLRRLNFVEDRIDQLLRLDRRSAQVLLYGATSGGDVDLTELREGDFHEPLIELKQALNSIFVRLRKAGRELRTRGPANPVWERLPSVPLPRLELLSVLAGARDERESVAKAGMMLDARPELDAAITGTADALRTHLAGTFQSPELDARAAIARRTPQNGSLTTRAFEALLRFYDHYEEYDAITLPIAYGQIGESDRVEVIRVSPEDATSIVDEVGSKRRKLGGIELSHFGGFFKRDWRQNDFLWGRLDAAERIITALLREDEADETLRTSLLEQAQREIIIDEFELEGPEREQRAAAIVEGLRRGDVDRAVASPVMLEIVGRATAVTGRLLRGLRGRYGISKMDWLVAVVAGLVAGVLEAAAATTRRAWVLRGAILVLLAASSGLLTWAAVSDRAWLMGIAASAVLLGLLAAAAVVIARIQVSRLGRPRPPGRGERRRPIPAR